MSDDALPIGTPTVYLAARYSRRLELCIYREELRALGIHVTSRWLDGEHQISDNGMHLGSENAEIIEGDSQHEAAIALRQRFAAEDWADLKAAGVCVSFTEPARSGPSRGGRHVEFGAAMAWGRRCIVVGHRENVFHALPTVEYHQTWQSALDEIEKLAVQCGTPDHRNGGRCILPRGHRYGPNMGDILCDTTGTGRTRPVAIGRAVRA